MTAVTIGRIVLAKRSDSTEECSALIVNVISDNIVSLQIFEKEGDIKFIPNCYLKDSERALKQVKINPGCWVWRFPERK